jgi:hypothetical protein
MLVKISVSISEMRSDFSAQLIAVQSEAKDQMHLLRSIKERLVFLENRATEGDRFLENNEREEGLMNEVRYLQREVQRLQQDNESLRNFRVPQIRIKSDSNPKIKEFDMLSRSEKSFSPIASPRNKPKDGSTYMRQIHEFRLDSEISQSMRPSKALLNDLRVQKIIDSDDNSVRTSRGVKQNSKVGQPIWNLVNPLKFLGKHASSVLGDSRDSNSGEIANPFLNEERKPACPVLPRSKNNLKPQPFDGEDSQSGSEKRRMSLKNVKNFDDFQQILRDLKMTLNASTYASFNENIDDNFKNLEDMLKKYSQLDERILQLYQRSSMSFKFDKRANVTPEAPPEPRILTTGLRINGSSQPPPALKELQLLKNSSNLSIYERRLKEIQDNPSEFESFIYKVKQELARREAEYARLEGQLLINS